MIITTKQLPLQTSYPPKRQPQAYMHTHGVVHWAKSGLSDGCG